MRRYQMRREQGRHFTASLLSFVLVLSNPGISAFAEGSQDADLPVTDVPYIVCSWNGSAVVSEEKKTDAVPVPSNGIMTSGWYYLNSDVHRSGRIESVTGNVNLTLAMTILLM